MNEWLKKVLTSIKNLWSKWKPVQKVILIGIIIVVIIAIVLTARISAKPAQYRILNTPITDTVRLNEILDRISEENISVDSDDRGYIYVSDETTARKLRTILSTEGLLPSNIDPFAGIFDRDIFTTDEDVKVKKLQAMQKQLTQHLETIPDIRVADVNIVSPEDKLFKEDQNPVTASVILKVTNNSDLYSNKKRIKGIQDLILSAVEGLKAENLIIADEDGNQINDFEGMAESDRIDNVKKQQKLIRQLEVEIRAKILKALQKTFTEDRCRDMVVAVEMDMSQRQSQSTEYKPIVIKEDNPDTPYDDSELRDTLPLSTQTVTKEWQGTGYNPEGPAGVEGQTPTVYSDMSNVIGRSTETGTTINHVQNRTDTTEISSPKPNKISVSVNLDGKWKKVKDNEGNLIIEDGAIKREYTPVSPEDMAEAEKSIKAAMGYDRSRGDQVAVTNIAYDRDDEFLQEDNAYFAALQRKRTILMILIAIAVVLVSFILFRIISRELERRRREREARLLAEQQAARERALWDAKEDSMEVTMSVEETRRMELQENAIAMAKEHPEDVAMLIRTWLMEE
ncbi:MAG: flagellar basal-body MS-ring/collar protein FliF [Treponema sp.]|nr:flagellar basal-body MS-ring/collar protein FliF [Treponema sp.]